MQLINPPHSIIKNNSPNFCQNNNNMASATNQQRPIIERLTCSYDRECKNVSGANNGVKCCNNTCKVGTIIFTPGPLSVSPTC